MQDRKMRIGLTMRVVHAQGYNEPRDAISQDWAIFLEEAFPDALWLPLPNLGSDKILSFCRKWDINRLILTGGEDVGVSRLRDETEFSVLDWAETNSIPTLGICRGMQLMSIRAGVTLKTIENHVNVGHFINGELSSFVNSYHRQAISECPQEFNLLALSDDGVIEAIRHQEKPMEGWMWHPERECSSKKNDIIQLRKLFK